MKAIEAGVLTNSTKDRLQSLEEEQEEIIAKISAAEFNIVDVSRDYVVAWLRSFQKGEVNDKEYMNNLFSTFVSAVYIYDDKRVKVVFAIGEDEKKTVDINLLDSIDGDDGVVGSFNASKGVPYQSQTNPVNLVLIGRLFVLCFTMEHQ